MSRARNIKPGFFKNDRLAECSPLARILFAGLWCEADREGRLEDRPKRLKADCLPYDDCDIEDLLNQLAAGGFIARYSVDGARYIAIPEFAKHQNPHRKESASTIPAPAKDSPGTDLDAEIPERARLIPDSPSLIPDSKRKALAPAASGSRLPGDWILPDEWRQWASTERPSIDARAEAAKFADYWHGAAGAKARKADWFATWRNWIRNAGGSNAPRAGPAAQQHNVGTNSAPISKTMATLHALEDRKNELRRLAGNRDSDGVAAPYLPGLGAPASG